MQAPTKIISDPQSEVQDSYPTSSVPEGFASNYTTANDLRKQQDEQLEDNDVFTDTPIESERYIGSWNDYDGNFELDNPNNLEYITQNNSDVAFLRQKTIDNGKTWNGDPFGFKSASKLGLY